MDADYWNLFWMTGMPQAWMLSRGCAETAPPAGRDEQGDGPGPAARQGWAEPEAPH